MDTRTGMILPEEHVPSGQRQHFVKVERDLTAKERCDAQIRLYAPCGCGSGKKFKFCCHHTGAVAPALLKSNDDSATFSYSTEETYCGWIARYSEWLRKQPINLTSEQKLQSFVTMLAKQNVAASTQNQAFNAIRFLYIEVLKIKLGDVNGLRARREATIRFAPSQEQVRKILSSVKDIHGYPTRLIVHAIYGGGLRVSEPLNLRIKDVDLSDSQFVIRGAKGGKDRVVAIPCCLIPAIKRQIKFARAMWERDQQYKIPVPLPGRLERKYPASRFAYATHAMQRGAFVRDVQAALGHVSLETTMGYLHTEAMRVQSPLETITA